MLLCQICDVNFGSNVDSFFDHMTDVHDSERLQCSHCKEAFQSGAEFAFHTLWAHSHYGPQASGTSLSYDCPLCNFCTTNQSALENHVYSAHNEQDTTTGQGAPSTSKAFENPNLSCFVCGVSCKTPEQLQSHVNQCLPESGIVDAKATQSDFELAKGLQEAEYSSQDQKEFKRLQVTRLQILLRCGTFSQLHLH